MRILDLISAFPDLYKAGDAVHLIGPPGIGKTDVLRNEVRARLGGMYNTEFGYHEVQVPTIDAPDVRGFLVPTQVTRPDGTKYPSAFYTRSALIPSEEYLKQHPRGIMVLDERNAGDMLTLKALAPAVLWKQFGEHKLPDGWIVVSTSNRISDRAGVSKPPTHLVNRERVVQMVADCDSWAVWAEEKGLHPMGIAFAKKFVGSVFTDAVPAGDGPFPTPRSFVAALKYLALRAGVDKDGNPNMALPDDPLAQEVVAGSVGDGTASQMFAFFKLHTELPDVEDIIKDPTGAKCPTRLDAAYAAMQMCIHYAQAKNADQIWQYVERLPKELQVSAAHSLIGKLKGSLLNTKRLGQWVANNSALIRNVMD